MDAIADVVLAYKPKPKSKPGKKQETRGGIGQTDDDVARGARAKIIIALVLETAYGCSARRRLQANERRKESQTRKYQMLCPPKTRESPFRHGAS